jgi:hypothetical protein
VEWPLEEIYIRQLWQKLLENNVSGISGFRDSPIEIVRKNGSRTIMSEETMDMIFYRDTFHCITLRNHNGDKIICYPDINYAIKVLDKLDGKKSIHLLAPSWRQLWRNYQEF